MRRSIVVNCEKIMIFSVLLDRSSTPSTSSAILRSFAESIPEMWTSLLTISLQELQWVSLGFESLRTNLVMALMTEEVTYLTKQS